MDISDLIKKERRRQRETLMLIPSENYTYPEVREAVGSVLMHKYAEGYPHKRYYQGNSVIDEVELECQRAALKAFSLSSNEWGVNVQPHSGCEANLAVYNALLKPGGRIMSMFLPEGGHLSHGWKIGDRKITLVSKIWNVDFYHVDQKTRILDYGNIQAQALKFRPKLIISGGTAYPREINHEKMSQIAQKVGAYYLADVAHEAGLVAGGANSSPFPYADVVTMTTHKTLRGPRGALIFSRKALSPLIDSSVFPGLQGGPHIHTIAGIAVALQKTQTKEFKNYALQTVRNAKYLSQKLIDFGFDLVSGGTDKHLILFDLRNKKINGWFLGWALEAAGIIANCNTVPLETSSPFYPSGLRLGTPAATVRGMKEAQMDQIAKWINDITDHLGEKSIPDGKEERKTYLKRFLSEIKQDTLLNEIGSQVKSLCRQFPIPDLQ